MFFTSTVEGPLDIGAMMVAFVEVYDGTGNLFNPPGGQVRVQTGAGDFLVFLHPGDKGTGKCEFAPLMGTDARYMFRMESTAGEVWSDWAVCDLALPFADAGSGAGDQPSAPGQLHKSFYVRFYQENEAPPVEPPYDHAVNGPFCDCTFTANVYTYDDGAQLTTPEDTLIRVEKHLGDSVWTHVADMPVSDKELGWSQFAPLWGALRKDDQGNYIDPLGAYSFQLISTIDGTARSDRAVCDLSIPFSDPTGEHAPCMPGVIDGQTYRHHRKMYVVQFWPRGGATPPPPEPSPPPPPPPPPGCPRCAEFEAQRAKVKAAYDTLGQAIADLLNI